MIERVRIRNFRCFRDITVEGFRGVNLIVGRNGVGKTALLDTLFACAATDLARIHPVAGQNTPGIAGTWFRMSGNESGSAQPQAEVTLADGRTVSLEARPAGPSNAVAGDASAGLQGACLVAGTHLTQANAAAFSELQEQGEDGVVLEAARILDPSIERLTVSAHSGEPTLCAIRQGCSLQPLAFCGEGAVRAAMIGCALARCHDGVLLVDVIESGLHHSVLDSLWRLMLNVAERLHVQVFATTHSWECISAAHQALPSNGNGRLRLIRLVKTDTDVVAVSYDRDILSAATENGIEVRG